MRKVKNSSFACDLCGGRPGVKVLCKACFDYWLSWLKTNNTKNKFVWFRCSKCHAAFVEYNGICPLCQHKGKKMKWGR